MRPLLTSPSVLAFGILGACFSDHGQVVAGAIRIGPDAPSKIDSKLTAHGYFSEVCFRLPPETHVDIGGQRVLHEHEAVTLSVTLISGRGNKMTLSGLSSLTNEEGSFACLSAPASARGHQYVGLEASASRAINVRDVRWISTDKL